MLRKTIWPRGLVFFSISFSKSYCSHISLFRNIRMFLRNILTAGNRKRSALQNFPLVQKQVSVTTNPSTILTNWTLKMHRNQWAQVALRVLIWVVVSGETAAGVVLDRSDVFNVSGVLALARHPNSVHLQRHGQFKSPKSQTYANDAYGMLFPFVDGLDVFLEILGHVAWQLGGVVVAIRNPSVDSVQLQEYTRGALVVVVVVLQGAWAILLDVNIAHGPRWWWLGVITVVDILSSARNLTRCSVFCVGWK